MNLQPYLKWAGGKRWFAGQYPHLFPRNFERYIEPFLGGGAVFFALGPSQAVLADTNSDLIATYQAIKDDWAAVWRELRLHARRHDDEYFYHVRAARPRKPATRAARFIYLNRTCWNGLYRVNRQGEFNVPRGTRNSVIFEGDDFESVARALRNSQLSCVDFDACLKIAGERDFVFVDPPYTVKHNCNGFQRYNESIFRWSDQERLANSVKRARDRGAMLLITNAAHDSVRQLFGHLGEEVLLSRRSLVASDPSRRNSVDELAIVVGYTARTGDEHASKLSHNHKQLDTN